MRVNLTNGGFFEARERPNVTQLLSVESIKPTVFHMSGGHLQIQITLATKNHLAQAADYIGRTLDVTYARRTDLSPFPLHLLLAFIAYHGRLPSKMEQEEILALLHHYPTPPSDDWLAESAIHTLAQQIVATYQYEEMLLPAGSWNLARCLFQVGKRLWRLTKEQASFWGTVSCDAEHITISSAQRTVCMHLASLTATSPLLQKLPLPLAPDATNNGEVWIDAISLTMGPGSPQPVLRAHGLGAPGSTALEVGTNIEHLAIPFEQAQGLDEIAEHILLSIDRPVPHYVGRILRLSVFPVVLGTKLAAWGIEQLVLQVEAEGVYVAACDHTGRSMVAAWWKADVTSARRAPLSFPPAAWALLHPILAALWHDLTSDTIVVKKPDTFVTPKQLTDPAQTHKRPARKTPAIIYLPPVRTETVEWTTPEDGTHIERVSREWFGYRRLPREWASRQEKRDFQQRQQAAAQRARLHHQPAPPPGFTFVAPAGAAAREHALTGLNEAPQIKARGLFSLTLGLQHIPHLTLSDLGESLP